MLEQAIDLEARLPERPDLVIRLAALLHDVGKPATRKFEPGGKVSFHHHDVVGRQAGPQAADRAAVQQRRGQGRRRAGLSAPALPRLRRPPGQRRRLDRLGRPPLRPRRRRSAGAAAHPDPGRLHDPEQGPGGPAARGVRRPGTADRRAGRRGGAAASCGPTSTAPRSWRSSASRPAATSAGPTSSCWSGGWTRAPLGAGSGPRGTAGLVGRAA